MAMKDCCAAVSKQEFSVERLRVRETKKRRWSKTLAYRSQLQKDNVKNKRHGKEGISVLPDDILVTILSLLSIKEAGRCSVLSSRWRYLWTFCTGKFELDYKKIFGGNLYDASLSSQGLWFVDRVLENYRGKAMDELIIRLPISIIYNIKVDKWVDFASRKVVRGFELDLTPVDSSSRRIASDFPGIERILSGWNIASEFTSLTYLRLSYVNVTGKVVEHFLAKCRFLKQLAVICSYSLDYLNVSGEALRLESLQVSHCICLQGLIINADSLVSLTYECPSMALVFIIVPLLSKLTIGDGFNSPMDYTNSMDVFGILQQLECLTMKTRYECYKKRDLPAPPRLPELFHLKHLTLENKGISLTSLLRYTSLIEKCPLLSRLTLRYGVGKDVPVEVCPSEFKNECLKVVELIGFEGTENDFQLALHLLKIAISLEKLIIVGYCFRGNYKKTRRESHQLAEHAKKQLIERVGKQLTVKLPASASIMMLPLL